MSYPKVVKIEIDKYLNAVRGQMQGASEEEVDEVTLHLREQIDGKLEETGDESGEAENIQSILSTMSQPESFATSPNTESEISRWGGVAMLTAVVSWAFNIGAIPWSTFSGIVWFLLLAIAAVSALISRKTVLGKVAMTLLILEAVSFPILHGMGMESKELDERSQRGREAHAFGDAGSGFPRVAK